MVAKRRITPPQNATMIQSIPVDEALPTSGQVLAYNGVPRNYEPINFSTGLVLKGTWDADTNDPTLGDSGAGADPGEFYVVDTAGSTSIDGISSWAIGDWALNCDDGVGGKVWKKVDNSSAVTSVFGRSGAVVAVSGDYDHSEIGNVGANDHHTPPTLPDDIEDGGSAEMNVDGLSGQLADTQKVQVKKNGANVGSRQIIDFNEGSNITLGVVDSGSEIDVTINASSGLPALTTNKVWMGVGGVATEKNLLQSIIFIVGDWLFTSGGGSVGLLLDTVNGRIRSAHIGTGFNQTRSRYVQFCLPSDFVSFPANALTIEVYRDGAVDSMDVSLLKGSTPDSTINASSILPTADQTYEVKQLSPGSTYSPGDVLLLKIDDQVDNGEEASITVAHLRYIKSGA